MDIQKKLLIGWMSERFKKWLEEIAKSKKIEENTILDKIILTIQNIEKETIEVLKMETKKECNPPLFIISSYPHESLMVKLAILESKEPDFFCDKEKVYKKMPFAALIIETAKLNQLIKELNSGLIVYGSANEMIVSYYDLMISRFFENYPKTKERIIEIFLKVVIEETFHYFCFQTNLFQIEEMIAEQKEKLAKISNLNERLEKQQEIERKYGVKEIVAQITKIIKPKIEDLVVSL
ncbi:hypothetical protein J7K86_03125 [bacterium]|nr:hypothetical protein [bacterium]